MKPRLYALGNQEISVTSLQYSLYGGGLEPDPYSLSDGPVNPSEPPWSTCGAVWCLLQVRHLFGRQLSAWGRGRSRRRALCFVPGYLVKVCQLLC